MKPMFFDTHIHFDDLIKEQPISKSIAEASDVTRMIAVGGSPESNRQAVELAAEYPQRIKAAIGYGRNRVGLLNPEDELKTLLETREIVAIGETGIDLHYDAKTENEQLVLFKQMLETARSYHLPVIVHSREAEELTLTTLDEHASKTKASPRGLGVLHCFTGSHTFAKELLSLGFFISFSGIITFKNAGELRDVAASIPEDRLLIETDSPYLAPEPRRGGYNQPSYIRHIAETLAEIRKLSLDEIATTTKKNAERLFL